MSGRLHGRRTTSHGHGSLHDPQAQQHPGHPTTKAAAATAATAATVATVEAGHEHSTAAATTVAIATAAATNMGVLPSLLKSRQRGARRSVGGCMQWHSFGVSYRDPLSAPGAG